MRPRIIGGAVLLLLGGVWIAQGLDLLKGSSMTGQGQWAVAGLVAAIVGAALIGWDLRSGRDEQ